MSDNKRKFAIVGAIIGMIACVGIGTSIASKTDNEQPYEYQLTVQDYMFLDTARSYVKDGDIPVRYNEDAVERGRAVCRNINRSDVSIAFKDEQKADHVEWSPAIILAAIDVYCPTYTHAIEEVEKYYGIR